MADVAFLGTGLMGEPMAARLVDLGFEVTVWNRTASRTERLAALGAAVAATPAAAVSGATFAVTMLANPTALHEVAFGPEGFAESLRAGATFVDMSTVGPDVVLDVAARLPEGVRVLDAPVLGSVPQAETGDLEIFVGGDEDAFGASAALLGAFGHATYVGPLGSGAAVKLVVNSALVSLQCVLGECLTLGDAFGLDQAKVLDALAASSLSPVVQKKRLNIESGDFHARFSVDNAVKDAYLVTEAARSRGVRATLAAAAYEWYQKAQSAGLGREDYSAVVKQVRG